MLEGDTMYPKENKQEKLIEATNSVEEKGLEINRHHFKDIDNVINFVYNSIVSISSILY